MPGGAPLSPATIESDPRTAWRSVPCLSCKATARRTIFETTDHLYHVPGVFRVVECAECGLWFQDPRPSDETLTTLYPDVYPPHHNPEQARMALLPSPATQRVLKEHLGYRHLQVAPGKGWRSSRILDPLRTRLLRQQMVPPFVEGGRLLELGCADGHQLEVFRALGWKDLHGIELFAPAAEKAREKGFEVRCAKIEDQLRREPTAAYDVVYSTMVVEHLQDPYLVLDEVARILKPGGRFHFSTICRDSFEARFFGEYWRALEVPRHMVFFRRSDIRRALEPNFGKIAAFDQVAARDLVASASWRGKRIDRAFTALGAKGLLPLSIAIALFHGSSRVSFQCVRKGSAAPSRGEQRD